MTGHWQIILTEPLTILKRFVIPFPSGIMQGAIQKNTGRRFVRQVQLVMILLIIIGLIVVQITIKGACIRSVQVGCFLRRPAVVGDKLFHPSLIVFQLYLRYTIPGLHGSFLARKSYQTYRGPLSKPAAR